MSLYSEAPTMVECATPAPNATLPSIHLRIDREFKSDSCISGYLFVEKRIIAYTLERPDVANLDEVSAIPAGIYTAHLRFGLNGKGRIQLEGVPNRTDVQIHIGTRVSNSAGCILVGMRMGRNACSLEDSSGAFGNIEKAICGALGVKKLTEGADLRIEIDDPPLPGHLGMVSLPFEEKSFQEALSDFNEPSIGVEEEYRRGNAAMILGMLRPTEVTAELLMNRLKTEHQPIVRGKIVESLGVMGTADPNTLPLLIQLAATGNTPDRVFALRGLGTMGPLAQNAQWAIRDNLNDPDQFIRQYAHWALESTQAASGDQTDNGVRSK
jgi:hypothetical protein